MGVQSAEIGDLGPPNQKRQPMSPHADQDKPPILGTWNRLYAFVLLLHALIIILFYIFTRAYS